MDVKKIAELSCLMLSREEEKLFQKQMNDIIRYVEKISTVDTKNIEPLVSPIEKKAYFREDKVKKTITSEEALKNAPDRKKTSFKTPLIKK